MPQSGLCASWTRRLARLVASAKVEDDRKLAKHYAAHAADHEADAKAHEALATQYAKTSPGLAGEARHYAAHSMEAAEALRSLAAQHQQAANYQKESHAGRNSNLPKRSH